jgi:HEAT repeat protein
MSHLRPCWSGFVLGACLLALAWGGPAFAQGRRFAPDPVEDLRQALRSDRDVPDTPPALQFRRDTLTRYADRITNLGDLGRALLLREWRNESLNPAVADADVEVWKEIGRHFIRDAKRAMASDDPERARAAATLVGDMAAAVQSAGIRSEQVEQQLANFTDDLIKLTESPNPALRTAAVRALGRLGLRATGTLKALEHTLRTDGVPQRRAAADSLIALIRLAAQSEREGGITTALPPAGGVPPPETLPRPRPGTTTPPVGTPPPLTGANQPIPVTGMGGYQTHNEPLIAMSGRVVPVASLAVQDSDAEVRRLGLEAILQAAQNLTDAIILPVSKEYPPPGRPITPEERDTILRDRREIREEFDLLKPLMERLRDAGGALAGAARDPEATVRVGALRTLEQIGYAREKLMRRWQAMPPEPKDVTPPKDEGKSKEKTALPAAAAGIVLVGMQQPAAPHPPAGVLPADPLLQGLEPALAAMIANLSDPNVKVRLAAIDALEMLGEPALPAVPALTRALGDCDLFVRWAAARTIGKMVPEDEDQPVPAVLVAAVPSLARLLEDQDLDLRLAVFTALGRFGPAAREAVPALTRMVTRGDEESRMGAMQALGGIGTDSAPAIPAVIQALSEPDARVRLAAARLLGRFGPVARAAAEPLRPLLNDPDPEVRRAASDAILSILRQ